MRGHLRLGNTGKPYRPRLGKLVLKVNNRINEEVGRRLVEGQDLWTVAINARVPLRRLILPR